MSNFTPGDDLAEAVDGLQQATLVRRGGTVSIPLDAVLPRPARTAEAAPSKGLYTKADMIWYLPVAQLVESPQPGDVIVDTAGARWTVLEVRRAVLRSIWRCTTRNLALAYGLDRHVDIERASFSKDAAGVEQPTWRTWKTGIAARLQPLAAEQSSDAYRQTTASRYLVYLAEQVELDHTCRIRTPDGKRFRILAVRKPQRIDMLLEVEVRPETQ